MEYFLNGDWAAVLYPRVGSKLPSPGSTNALPELYIPRGGGGEGSQHSRAIFSSYGKREGRERRRWSGNPLPPLGSFPYKPTHEKGDLIAVAPLSGKALPKAHGPRGEAVRRPRGRGPEVEGEGGAPLRGSRQCGEDQAGPGALRRGLPDPHPSQVQSSTG